MRTLTTILMFLLLPSCTDSNSHHFARSTEPKEGSPTQKKEVYPTQQLVVPHQTTRQDYEVYLVFEVSLNGQIVITAVESRRQHQRIYTSHPRRYTLINGETMVPSRDFFSKEDVHTLTFKAGDTHSLQFEGGGPRLFSQRLDGKALSAVENGKNLEVQYVSRLDGSHRILIQASRISPHVVWPEMSMYQSWSKEDAVEWVAYRLNEKNKLDIGRDMLRAMKNPKGEGWIVYTPKFRVSGFLRFAVWFVLDGKVYSLNSPALMVSEWKKPSWDFVARWHATNLDAPFGLTQDVIKIVYYYVS